MTLDRSRAPKPGPLRPFDFPAIHRSTLSNGLSVAMVEIPHFPVVTFSVVLDAGGIGEPDEAAGVASLTSSLLESGAGNRSATEIAEQSESLGVHISSGTSWDISSVGLSGLRSRMDAATEILADVVQLPTFPQEEVERLRNERLAEILQRRSDPRALAGEAALRTIYSPETPFSRPLGGTTDTVQRLTRPEVSAFHADSYSPQSATIIVVGNMAAAEAVELAERRFGGWAGGRRDVAAPEVRPREERARVVIVDRPGSVQSEIRVGHVGVARSTPDFFPLMVLNTILGGAFSSRLNLNLRERHGFTYGASSGFAMRRHAGPFLISTAVQTEVTAPATTEILREVRVIREEPVTPQELDDARNYLAGVFPLRLQTTEGIASRLAELVVYGLPDNYFDTYRDNILAVSADAIHRAAVQHLRPEQFAVVVVGDAAQIRGPLGELEIGPLSVVDATGQEK